MSITEVLGRLAGIENLRSVSEIKPSFAASWAQGGSAWLFFGCLGLSALAVLFYLKYQGKSRTARIFLAAFRAALLSLLFLFLAEPILTVKLTSTPKPILWLLFDGTDSMAIVDEVPDAERGRLERAVGLSPASSAGSPAKLSREGYVQALLRKEGPNLLRRLEEKFRLQAFLFDRPEGVRLIETSSGTDRIEPAEVADQLTTEGQVTALGSALSDLASRHAAANLAGLLLVSDFDQNAGPPPLAGAKKLGVPVYTLGVGPASAVDLQVDLQAPLLMKKAERSSVVVILRQSGLEGKTAKLRLTALRQKGKEAPPSASEAVPIAEREVTLGAATLPIEIPFTPSETGRFLLAAEAERVEGEVVGQNNRAEREAHVLDDFLHLLYVEYEPTWEWRFIKEVFHRDKLVGLRGFRTFLRSADPRVRQTNQLFLSTLTPVRSEFFSSDVIFLGDMPSSALSPRFAEMTREFVSKFGGGLVVLAGPRFGPGQLAGSGLADMLPVIVDPDLRLRGDREFRLRLTPDAEQVDFMKLGSDEAEDRKAWSNLGPLPWYQPVARLSPMGTCLAEHPSDTCADGKTPQPLIAIRRYGRGEVVYIGFNETWRLRRKYGEMYYRQFWGQMIHRLGLSHALGSQKRFVVRTDRQEYQEDDTAVVTVEAYDANFEPLSVEKLPERRLTGELFVPGRNAVTEGGGQPIALLELREGVFETRIPVYVGGEHRVRVKDPVTGEDAEVSFQVASLSAERKGAVRNLALQVEIARATGGESYDLETVDRLPGEVKVPQKTETSIRVFPLWNTWLCFACVVALMLGEWLFRKLVNLS